MLLPKKKLVAIVLSVGIIAVIGNFFTTQPKASEATAPEAKLGIPGPEMNKLLESLPTPTVNGISIASATKPKIYAKSYIVLDNESKYPLLAKDVDAAVPIASTTKIMTALVALDMYSLDKVITISPDAVWTEGSRVDFYPNERMTAKNLLYALMLNSANNAAYALAEASGSVETFVAAMNTKAETLGLRNTKYKDPAGLNDEGRSSPRDLAILMDYALTNPTFKTIVQTSKYTIQSADARYAHELTNSNRLVNPDESLYFPLTLGGKTGFTYEAGHCLVAAAQSDGKRYIAVVLNTHADTITASAEEARKLLVWATSN